MLSQIRLLNSFPKASSGLCNLLEFSEDKKKAAASLSPDTKQFAENICTYTETQLRIQIKGSARNSQIAIKPHGINGHLMNAWP